MTVISPNAIARSYGQSRRNSMPLPAESSVIRADPSRCVMRVGAVSYLNSKPLIEGLAERLGTPCSPECEATPAGTTKACCSLDASEGQSAPEACDQFCRAGGQLTLDVPSRLADQLALGELDVALIPSVEALAGDGYQIISDACVAARGPVRSVKLYSRVPAGDIRTLALDEGSRTSAALSRTILSERYGVEPELKPFPLGSSLADCDADAMLMIGDRAMHPPTETFVETWDLGEHWFRWTGRPFVFAVWVARAGVPTQCIADTLSKARDAGVAAIHEIAERDGPLLQLSADSAESYLRKNLHFHFGNAERKSLELFRQLATAAGVIRHNG